MTFAALQGLVGGPPARLRLPGREAPVPRRVSVVVPVRDNQEGVTRLLEWWSQAPRPDRPSELVFVDDGSRVPIEVDAPGVRVIRGRGKGPAAARNLGWRAATGDWCGFVDSDCVPVLEWGSVLQVGWDGEIAIQGAVHARGRDRMSRFYDSQHILEPMLWTGDGRPSYLITANACVHREALEVVGGFNESFTLAAGEDVELGLRLSAVGAIRWNAAAGVTHDYEPSLAAFVRRFFRYGRGNRVLAQAIRGSGVSPFRPRPFAPRDRSPANFLLSWLAFSSLSSGWWFERLFSSSPLPAAER